MAPMTSDSPTLNINLGNFRTAKARRAAYEKAAARDGARSLGDWLKKMGDKASGFDQDKVESKP
jgi:hypothetical protein